MTQRKMIDLNEILSYSIALFMIVLISGCIVNLFKYHFMFQLVGIAFFFTYSILQCFAFVQDNPNATIRDLYFLLLPHLTGISACLISMVAGFWIFPHIRKRVKA